MNFFLSYHHHTSTNSNEPNSKMGIGIGLHCIGPACTEVAMDVGYRLCAPKTEVRRLFSKFFTANILFWEYLGVVCFRPKNHRFLQEKDPATLSHEQGTHSAKIVPIVWLEIAKMPPKISAQFVCPSPKVSNF